MIKFFTGISLLIVATMFPMQNLAQAVVFPSQTAPGVARSFHSADSVYELSNDILAVCFTERNGKLIFSGSQELGLKPGTELFNITLADGTKVSSSDMTFNSVDLVDLSADPAAIVASEQYPGKAISASLSYGDLQFEWSAILRDESHYLRTLLTLTAQADVAMKSIVPMIYEVDAENAPSVVGNTRGAVLLSENIFAGLETPTGINSVVSVSDKQLATVESDSGFSYGSWIRDTTGDTQPADPAYWKWEPADELPAGISGLGFSASDVRGKRGFVNFAQAGTHTATFQYTAGTHGLNIVGVDVVDAGGNIVASDYHIGFTGGASHGNVYSLDIPQSGDFLVRYFVEIKTETITANGTITWSPAVSAGSAPASSDTDTGFSIASWSADTDNDYFEGILSNPAYWTWAPGSATPSGITALGLVSSNIRGKRGFIRASQGGSHTVTFQYLTGSHGLNVVGVDLLDSEGNVVASDYHIGFTGGASHDNIYNINVPQAGVYILRYFIEVGTETVTSSGSITWSPSVSSASGFDKVSSGSDNDPKTFIQGLWSRQATLAAGKSWSVSAVVGVVASNQARRSFLAYSERERAVPWRPFPHYNSWYELNIDRNNSATYDGHMTTDDCVAVVNQWKTNLFDRYDTSIKAFVWDDGWDEYGTWTFNKGFPNGFKEPYELARDYGVGTGAWLGPVGGYGTSGSLRRQYWADKGGMQLSNPAYYKVFLDACSDMVNKYDFCFFKLDGISAQFSSVGPDSGATGEENAEGIIDILSAVRGIRPDMFFNTTVGTWASPFWFHFTDAVWRQEGDHGTIGDQGDDRERWITYRDRLVYQNFVQNSPICPINTLMTHGVILTEYGDVSKTMDYDGIVRELRCAFACGSGMVELYCDSKLLNNINGGALWGDIAECIKWQERNADVLPDIHWVGGNPWDGSRANVYGWASWNGDKATLALRNPAAYAQTYTFTLRDALDIPAYVSDRIRFSKAFFSQVELSGLTENQNLGLDDLITVTLPASSVFVFDGTSELFSGITDITPDAPGKPNESSTATDTRVFDLLGRECDSENLTPGVYVCGGKKFVIR